RSEALFRDHLFAAASERISADDVFALSDDMKHYLSTEIAGQLRAKGPQRGLIDALYDKTQLKLEYDSEMTRNASQTFAARAGRYPWPAYARNRRGNHCRDVYEQPRGRVARSGTP